jgi:hypothetical protein
VDPEAVEQPGSGGHAIRVQSRPLPILTSQPRTLLVENVFGGTTALDKSIAVEFWMDMVKEGLIIDGNVANRILNDVLTRKNCE